MILFGIKKKWEDRNAKLYTQRKEEKEESDDTDEEKETRVEGEEETLKGTFFSSAW